MARTNHVWGIEIGQSSLKALRCHLEGDNVVTDAFDFIEYPKILSQPEAEPEKMVSEALEQFLSRNETKQCKIAISVAGQSGLAKFFKPPPMDAKKIPDIVKYEARQQIPYDLNEVVWDYQTMPGAQIEDGFALESEVGLFAMKREAVYRAIKPLRDVGLEVDLIQLAPLAIYNMIAYDRMDDRLKEVTFDSESPPSSTIVLAMGTDATDLIVTNGFRVWQRSMPLGGNHFTRQLTKDLKLTFAKAEHLKKNAMAADDPKLIFQAMRPVFNDMVTEVQRSVSFYRSLNKKAELGGMVLLGNSIKLPGLPPYLNKNLGYEVEVCEEFKRLTGSEVLNSPAFKENQLAFGVVYGLCLQLLGKGPVHTSLVPKEIVTERLVRAKKPWALVAAASLMLGLLINVFMLYRVWKEVHPSLWKDAQTAADGVKTLSDKEIGTDNDKKAALALLSQIGTEVSGNADRRLLWMELLRSINAAIPRDPNFIGKPYPAEFPYPQRADINVESIESKFYPDLTKWWVNVRKFYREDTKAREFLLGLDKKPAAKPAADGAAPEGATEGSGDAAAPNLPSPEGSGWVVQLKCYHYFHPSDPNFQGRNYVRRTFIQNLEEGAVELPIDRTGKTALFKFKDLGIGFPTIARQSITRIQVPNPEYYEIIGQPMPTPTESSTPAAGSGGSSGRQMSVAGSGGGGSGSAAMSAGGDDDVDSKGSAGATGASGTTPVKEVKNAKGEVVKPTLDVEKYSFTLQFAWVEKPLSARLEEMKKKELEEKQKKEAAEGQPTEGEAATGDEAVAANP